MKDVALVTARAARDLDEDLPPLALALARARLSHDVVLWDDTAVDCGSYRLVVVRSTWDYVARRDAFLGWADRVAAVTRLMNPAPILRWNTDKRYLRELAGRGVPVVPTHWIEPGQATAIPFEGDVVVKPAVSAGAQDAARYSADRAAEARAHVERLGAEGRTAMVQPYLHGVDDAGETSVIYVGGAYSHSIEKGPILAGDVEYVRDLYAREDVRPREPSAAERSLADRALSLVPAGPHGLLYARVDVAPGPDGRPVVLELETTEPSLFLAYAPGSAERLVTAVARLLAG